MATALEMTVCATNGAAAVSSCKASPSGSAAFAFFRKQARFPGFRISSSSPSSSEDGKSIKVTIEANAGGSGEEEAPKVVIQVPRHQEQEDGHDAGAELSRDAIAQVASESAVESPAKVHEAAVAEAAPIAGGSGKRVEAKTEQIEKEAAEAAQEFERSEDEDGGEEEEEQGKGSVLQSVSSGVQMAKESMSKRAKVLALVAEDAGAKGSRIVEAAKRGIEELREKLDKSSKEVSKHATAGGAAAAEDEEDERRKHSAVGVEDVNKDGEAVLKEQRRRADEEQQEEGDDDEGESAVEEVMREIVEPAMASMDDDEWGAEQEIGDGNEHLKDPGNLVQHDAYSPNVSHQDDHY